MTDEATQAKLSAASRNLVALVMAAATSDSAGYRTAIEDLGAQLFADVPLGVVPQDTAGLIFANGRTYAGAASGVIMLLAQELATATGASTQELLQRLALRFA